MSARGLDPGWGIALGVLGWLGGIAAQLQQPTLWPAATYAALCAAACALGCVAALTPRGRWITLPLALALAGGATTGLRAHDRLAQSLDPALEGADLLLTGVVASLPQVGPAGTRFVFEVESAQRATKRRPHTDASDRLPAGDAGRLGTSPSSTPERPGTAGMPPRPGAEVSQVTSGPRTHGRSAAPGADLHVPSQVPSRIALGWYRNDRDEAFSPTRGPSSAPVSDGACRCG
jgi:predicted membrane metal-binding protein